MGHGKGARVGVRPIYAADTLRSITIRYATARRPRGCGGRGRHVIGSVRMSSDPAGGGGDRRVGAVPGGSGLCFPQNDASDCLVLR